MDVGDLQDNSALDRRAEHNALERPTVDAPIYRGSTSKAATKLQKVYRSYRIRRWLADSAVAIVREENWSQVIDYARSNHRTVTFFNNLNKEMVKSQWNRIGLNACKVGQGLSKDANALTLTFQHWIEAIDPSHHYGHNLKFYFKEWDKSPTREPFFYWLNVGGGRDLDLKECPRSLLREQCVEYLSPQKRKTYECEIIEEKIVNKQTRKLLDTTNKGPEERKWIFVMSASRKFYAGQKEKGKFHHSSFLAGGATLAAGRFIVEIGVLKSIWDDSGHYRPSGENLNQFLTFLREKGVDLNEVQIHYNTGEQKSQKKKAIESVAVPECRPQPEIPVKLVESSVMELTAASQIDETAASKVDESLIRDEAKITYRRTSSGGRKIRADMPTEAVLERINSKKQKNSHPEAMLERINSKKQKILHQPDGSINFP